MKRKEYNAAADRLVDRQQKSLQKQGARKNPPKAVVQTNMGPIPKWKAQSIQFRQGLKAGRI
jgi:hypothetical protein